ncbi:MAG: hypothetical protein QOF36_2532 [Microbacteriaceae bacterium]|jgi:hypothetical protein|nr:hypothetical protein [Microbacteriaceae bacterium]
MPPRDVQRGAGRIKTHSLQRSLAALSINVVREEKAREDELEPQRLAEGEQQFQIDVSGKATGVPDWQDAYLDFTEALFCLEGERDNPAVEPQFWWGVKLDSAIPVMFSVLVMEWNTDQNEAFTGAKCKVGVWSLSGDVEFRGRVHVTFQGYGTPVMDESE